ncbi:PH domain-containing protein [Candidatus Saccharibacteria bacterium]|jgi:glucan phosphoethanolaminetransferase (alkaline phosphatase superfamily)|nr:PH domain-containing protein [Candidatus Saccharibacteria bacterium]
MKEIKIQKSRKLAGVQFIVVTTVTILLVILSFVLLRGMRVFLGRDITTFGLILRILIVLLAIAAAYVTNLSDKNKTYILRGEKLIISNNGFGLSTRETILKIAPSSVSRIKLEQSILGKMLDVGTITISIDGNSGKKVHRLVGIDNPKKIIVWLESGLGDIKK